MKAIYGVLADHQQDTPWKKRELFEKLHRWARLFDLEFKLRIPEIALYVDRLHIRRLGHFRRGHNGFGLRGEVALNQAHLRDREFWEVLGTLLHEILHAWQQAHGKPGSGNYHNKGYRTRAEALGLIVDSRGVTRYRRPSPFIDLLEREGVSVPVLPVECPPVRRGTSKLKKWSCGCTNVRVAVDDFRARCLKCNRLFIKEGV